MHPGKCESLGYLRASCVQICSSKSRKQGSHLKDQVPMRSCQLALGEELQQQSRGFGKLFGVADMGTDLCERCSNAILCSKAGVISSTKSGVPSTLGKRFNTVKIAYKRPVLKQSIWLIAKRAKGLGLPVFCRLAGGAGALELGGGGGGIICSLQVCILALQGKGCRRSEREITQLLRCLTKFRRIKPCYCFYPMSQ